MEESNHSAPNSKSEDEMMDSDPSAPDSPKADNILTNDSLEEALNAQLANLEEEEEEIADSESVDTADKPEVVQQVETGRESKEVTESETKKESKIEEGSDSVTKSVTEEKTSTPEEKTVIEDSKIEDISQKRPASADIAEPTSQETKTNAYPGNIL